MLRILVRQSTWTSITVASAFFSCFSRSGTSLATTSMTFIFSASSADRLTASRTARSAHSAFLPRILARPRIYAAASLICLRIKVSFFSSFSDPPPPRATGEAAPRLVPGAMAAMWLAYRMKVPALAARAPPGATKLATWTGEARMSLMISRIEVSSPPGVSMRSTTSCALSFAARCSPRRTKPAIAIDQTSPVRTSRSTVGTMTELNDHLKLLFARAARLHCRGCGKPVVRDTPQSIYESLLQVPSQRLVITFPVKVPKNFTEKEVEQLLQRQGYTRIHARANGRLEVIQDRIRMSSAERARVIEALESALRVGQGRVNVYAENQGQTTFSGAAAQEKTWSVPDFAWRYSSDLHCADCDIHYSEATPAAFSFNSPLGACETCRGFGRVIGVDFGLVVPDAAKTLRQGAVRPWQSPSFKDCQGDLVKYAKKRAIPLDLPFHELSSIHKDWVLEGEADWQNWRKSWPGTWYGVRRFFKWLETKAYKMHIRVLLSKYRAYTECGACHGTRLKPDALLWKLDGKSIHELMLLPVSSVNGFFQSLSIDDEAADLVLREIRSEERRVGKECRARWSTYRYEKK